MLFIDEKTRSSTLTMGRVACTSPDEFNKGYMATDFDCLILCVSDIETSKVEFEVHKKFLDYYLNSGMKLCIMMR